MTKMWKVALALIPVTLVSVIFFGFYSLYLVFATAISAVIFEYPFKKPENYLGDGSAFFAGMILGLTLSPDSPWWIPIVGAFILVVIAKQFFGGLGLNIFNPALVARGILLLAWPIHMVQWVEPFDTVSSATPLGLGLESFTNWDLFLGVVPGSIGETSALAIILGTIYLLYKGYIGFRIPLSYIISAGLMAVILGLNPIFTVLSGGLLFAAMYMATDPVTSPQEDKAKIVYGIGCGVLTVIIREYTPYPEGVTFAILMMNASAYLFDNLLGDYSLPRLKIKKKKLFQLSTILIASIVLLAVSISSYLLISNKTGGETKILIQNKMEEYFPEAEQFSIIHSENKRTVLAKISGEEDQVGYLSYLKTEGYINSIEKIFVCDEQGTIRTVEILKENESPTLGARISGKEFLGQFTGITVQNRKELTGARTSGGACGLIRWSNCCFSYYKR
ncbi:MAG: RnfABCDGE type electron transport complex subunit D [bacterium]